MQRHPLKKFCSYCGSMNILSPLKRHPVERKQFFSKPLHTANQLSHVNKTRNRHLGIGRLEWQSRKSFSVCGVPMSILIGELDRYNGMWVDLRQLTSGHEAELTMDIFDKILRDSLRHWESQNITCVWLTVPIHQSSLIEVASQRAFHFHHAEGNSATLTHYMCEDVKHKIPQFATHQVGVSGVAVNEETQEVLVVMDKNRKYKLWKFPGGLADLGEDIALTAVREVHEETGVHTEFQSILAFRQQHDHPNAFGRSDIYVICRLKPLTFDLQPCTEEISAIQWMPVGQLLTESLSSQMSRQVASLVVQGLRHGFNTVDIASHQIESIYKKNKIQMFHRPLHETV